jgi:hypoxanthine phosphoribosyltransferase
MRAADIADQLTTVLVTEEQIHAKLGELARASRPTTPARTCC